MSNRGDSASFIDPIDHKANIYPCKLSLRDYDLVLLSVLQVYSVCFIRLLPVTEYINIYIYVHSECMR